jgi:hypothetical protein
MHILKMGPDISRHWQNCPIKRCRRKVRLEYSRFRHIRLLGVQDVQTHPLEFCGRQSCGRVGYLKKLQKGSSLVAKYQPSITTLIMLPSISSLKTLELSALHIESGLLWLLVRSSMKHQNTIKSEVPTADRQQNDP